MNLGNVMARYSRLISIFSFLVVLVLHATYIRLTASPGCGVEVGTDSGDWLGFAFYIRNQDYLLGLSYALSASFSVWAIMQYVFTRRAAMAAGAVGSLTLAGLLMASGCFFVGCCGSPMLGIYIGLLGGKTLGVGKPFIAAFNALSIALAYWYLRRRSASCGNNCGCLSSAAGKHAE